MDTDDVVTKLVKHFPKMFLVLLEVVQIKLVIRLADKVG
jgi:hypothetical protein